MQIDQAFRKMGEERYHQYLTLRETHVKVKAKQNKKDEVYDELKKRFPKHLYDSEAEESDYELNDRDLNPPSALKKRHDR